MKNLSLIILMALFLAACQQQQKIGFIDNGKVINEYQEKIDIEAKYKIKEDAFTKRTDSIGQAFQLEAQDFQVKSKTMSASKAQAKYEELGQKQQLLQQQIQFEQQQIQQAFGTEIDSVIAKVKAFVKDYGSKNGYTFILGTSNASSSVMYGTEENDLTDEIIKALNEDFKKD
ncbi:MAG: OmpH family outer membrane protein [Flavobacteriaceae bacterium]|nr:OmpH family outer membrane protein [Flavobacteriaceae bacterium]